MLVCKCLCHERNIGEPLRESTLPTNFVNSDFLFVDVIKLDKFRLFYRCRTLTRYIHIYKTLHHCEALFAFNFDMAF